MAFAPSFLESLARPDIQTILLCGCGGGFDFVHSLVLYPILREWGKQIIIGSYSFGDPNKISGPAPVIFAEGNVIAKRVTAHSRPDRFYCPEVHVCSFLDQHYPNTVPHFVYAYYARAFAIPTLSHLYTQFISAHEVDAIVLVDGGSDALMVGDEDGLGDPVEDAVSVATVASLDDLKLKFLLNIGIGSDRFNNVSDAATLRAIAELTAAGGFRGAISLEQNHTGLQFYRDCIQHIYERQQFRSIISGMILGAVDGYFGDDVPSQLTNHVNSSDAYIWPLMAMLWAFDVDTVARRSQMVKWFQNCTTPHDCIIALDQERSHLGIRPVENIPRHETMRFQKSPS